ncbi:hypothetical protein R77592_04357 [Ralstonia mannitolilytica]|nr:hypothetical protein R77592_04357 [Ralstonia mannitolilytica]
MKISRIAVASLGLFATTAFSVTYLPTARVLGRVMCSPMAHAEFDASRP